jgi:hypothetical protein
MSLCGNHYSNYATPSGSFKMCNWILMNGGVCTNGMGSGAVYCDRTCEDTGCNDEAYECNSATHQCVAKCDSWLGQVWSYSIHQCIDNYVDLGSTLKHTFYSLQDENSECETLTNPTGVRFRTSQLKETLCGF